MAKHANEEQLKDHLKPLVSALVECLQGRIWEGKDKAVAALVAIAGKCKETVKADQDLQQQVCGDGGSSFFSFLSFFCEFTLYLPGNRF